MIFYIILFAVLILIFNIADNSKRKKIENGAEKKKRKPSREECWKDFNDDLPREAFLRIVRNAVRGVKRLKITSIDGPVINGTVRSQSGISDWQFSIDYNDYGHISGKYWLQNYVGDSEIPEVIAKRIRNDILEYLKNPTSREASINDGAEKRCKTEHHYKFCPYCGKEILISNAEFCGYCGENLKN